MRVDSADRSRIPASGPVVVVANHPYGVLDGAILTVLLTCVRPDVKVLTNFLLSDVPELQQHCIFVDPFQTDRSAESNRKALREALAWLHQGGMLAIFPAGEVAHWQMPAGTNRRSRVERHSRAPDSPNRTPQRCPYYFCGHNSVGFQLDRHDSSQAAHALFYCRNSCSRKGKRWKCAWAATFRPMPSTSVANDRRSYRLSALAHVSARPPQQIRNLRALESALAARLEDSAADCYSRAARIARAEKSTSLSADRCLAENSEFAVYLATAREMPNLLLELGRLRELTFRQAGEGTGKRLDLDSFDAYYWHVLLWHKTKHELVGAYRAGSTC